MRPFSITRSPSIVAPTRGVDTSLTLGGFSAQNARKLARRYLEGLSWTK